VISLLLVQEFRHRWTAAAPLAATAARDDVPGVAAPEKAIGLNSAEAIASEQTPAKMERYRWVFGKVPPSISLTTVLPMTVSHNIRVNGQSESLNGSLGVERTTRTHLHFPHVFPSHPRSWGARRDARSKVLLRQRLD
jgi:hypothetical protein